MREKKKLDTPAQFLISVVRSTITTCSIYFVVNYQTSLLPTYFLESLSHFFQNRNYIILVEVRAHRPALLWTFFLLCASVIFSSSCISPYKYFGIMRRVFAGYSNIPLFLFLSLSSAVHSLCDAVLRRRKRCQSLENVFFVGPWEFFSWI